MHLIHAVIAICNVTDAVVANRRRSERVATITVNLWTDPTAERERGKRVIVCEEDYRVDQLREGPAVLFGF